jgi:hypothetical protein
MLDLIRSKVITHALLINLLFVDAWSSALPGSPSSMPLAPANPLSLDCTRQVLIVVLWFQFSYYLIILLIFFVQRI